MPLSISFAPKHKIIKSILLSDKVHSALFKPPDEVLPETLPFITAILNHLTLGYFVKQLINVAH